LKREPKQNLEASSLKNIEFYFIANNKLDMIGDFVEAWCIVLRDHAFQWFFERGYLDSKFSPFKEQMILMLQ